MANSTPDDEKPFAADAEERRKRRFRDLKREFAREIGAQRFHDLPLSVQSTVRSLAFCTVELETLEQKRIAGDVIDPVAFCRLVGNQRRGLNALERVRARLAPAAPSLAETLAQEARARGGESCEGVAA